MAAGPPRLAGEADMPFSCNLLSSFSSASNYAKVIGFSFRQTKASAAYLFCFPPGVLGALSRAWQGFFL
jgi:hypothetical protein